MLNLLKQVPAYAYLAVGLVGATATYLFYEPTYSFILSNSSNKNDSSKSRKGKLQLHPRGLINHRNECFINVILQSMASSNKVIEWLVFNKPQSSFLFDTLSKIIALINRLEIAHLNSDSDIDQKPDFSDFNLNQDNLDFYAANHIKKSLNQHNWHIKSSDEHDCHEFFHLLMDVLDDELNELNKSNKSLNFFGSLSAATASTSLRRNRNPFHGYLVSQFECLDCFYKVNILIRFF
jgi:ubiquitin C-terminal hydrolase